MFSSLLNALTSSVSKNTISLKTLICMRLRLVFDKTISILFVSMLFVGCGGGSPFATDTIRTATFLYHDDSIVDKFSAKQGSSIIVPTILNRTDYIFTGWQEVGGSETIAIDATSYTLTKDIIFKAQYIYDNVV
ncbi:MAG: InlB B-repeat-containing protein, partial [Campylobacteraceae bacterium]|nr:InlB B-repeat-containing protein [Campylobacteraceae bacterium]